MRLLTRIWDWALGRFRKTVEALPRIEVTVDPNSRKHLNVGGYPKVRYRNVEMANAGRKRMEAKTGFKFNSYQCPVCDGWHIGKKQA